jgi:hypothetical protein
VAAIAVGRSAALDRPVRRRFVDYGPILAWAQSVSLEPATPGEDVLHDLVDLSVGEGLALKLLLTVVAHASSTQAGITGVSYEGLARAIVGPGQDRESLENTRRRLRIASNRLVRARLLERSLTAGNLQTLRTAPLHQQLLSVSMQDFRDRLGGTIQFGPSRRGAPRNLWNNGWIRELDGKALSLFLRLLCFTPRPDRHPLAACYVPLEVIAVGFSAPSAREAVRRLEFLGLIRKVRRKSAGRFRDWVILIDPELHDVPDQTQNKR